ncbi:MAG: tripartite tricarboxylate transporter substrate binding protein [Betaproteobacteria bacterium]|nr:tripartite tricarboxylate transporter substrate binding protein [Betaproteobacteria bacterium]
MNIVARLAWSVCLLLSCLQVAQAQVVWPGKPVKVLVPFPAGGQLDVVVRSVTDKLAPILGQTIVVENRTGADGNIAAEAVARSAPDGSTWLATSVPFATGVSLAPKSLRFDPVADFKPVANLGTSSFVLCVPAALPVKTVAEFIAYAKANPGKISYAGTSRGSVTHLSTEMFKRATGTEMEFIGYAGIPPAPTDLIGGRLQFMSLGIVAAMPQITAGKVRPLAVLDAERHPLLPDVPSIAEAGYPDVLASTWFGLLVPAQVPRELVQTLNAEVMKIVRSPEIVDKFKGMGVNPVAPNTPEQFEAFLKADIARWGKVIREAKIAAE